MYKTLENAERALIRAGFTKFQPKTIGAYRFYRVEADGHKLYASAKETSYREKGATKYGYGLFYMKGL